MSWKGVRMAGGLLFCLLTTFLLPTAAAATASTRDRHITSRRLTSDKPDDETVDDKPEVDETVHSDDEKYTAGSEFGVGELDDADGAAAQFTYFGPESGPQHWHELSDEWAVCADGKNQSPIDIPATTIGGKKILSSGSAAQLLSLPDGPVEMRVTDAHGAPKFACKPDGNCGTLTHDGTEYRLLQVHWHSPSENTIDMMHYPLEMHYVFCAGGCELGTDKFAVYGVLFQGGGTDDDPNTEAMDVIDLAWKDLASHEKDTEEVDLVHLIDQESGYYHWMGSLTTPPCTEGVAWFLQAKTERIKSDQAVEFMKHIGGHPGNARPVQPINDRKIEAL